MVMGQAFPGGGRKELIWRLIAAEQPRSDADALVLAGKRAGGSNCRVRRCSRRTGEWPAYAGSAYVRAERLDLVRESAPVGCGPCLKDAVTLVAPPGAVYINPTRNSGSHRGTGDVQPV